MPPRPRFLTVANFVRKKNAPKTPRSIACTHPEFVLVVRKTFAVTKPISMPCKPRLGTAGRAGRGFEVLKAFFFSPPSSTRGILPRLVLLSWAGERNRAGSSCPSNRETQQETPLKAALLGCSARARAQDKRGARAQDKSSARNVQ